MRRRAVLYAILFLAPAGFQSTFAQAPTGMIAGRVTDPSGAAVPTAHVAVINKDSGLQRTSVTSPEGKYSVSTLPPGAYQVEVLMSGFQKVQREAIVETGTTTTSDFAMQIGPVTSTITADAADPGILNVTFDVSGVTTRGQIDGVPLNGRDFLELAKLEPGAQQATRGSNNRTFVPLLGAPSGGNPGRSTRVTIDGGSIMQIGNGGAAMGFSQEVVQEFQVSGVNFDLSTGPTASGSVNAVTRSGGNQWRGSAFYFFRDNQLSAYPALKLDPFNPHPYFQRQQYGLAAGGPVIKDRLFIFGTFERNDQVGVVSTEILTPEFSSLSRITPSPSDVDQAGVRLDWNINGRNTLFLRQSHEGGFSFAPTTVNGVGPRAYPSAWTRQPEWSDQSIAGWTWQPGSALVNDLRFSYFFVSSSEQAPGATDCSGCLGIGAPSINVSDLFIGTSTTTVVLGRRFHVNDVATALRGNHQFRFGGDWEITRGGRTDVGDDPVTMDLFSPQNVRNFNALQPPNNRIPLPASFLTLDQILQLPVMDFSVGIGNPQVPQAGFGAARISSLIHLFAQDTWRLMPNFTLTYGLAWTYGTPLNYDLHKPDYLLPIVGVAGLVPTHKNWKDFSPAVGIAWSPGGSGKTVIRSGVGLYYDFQTSFGIADNERVSLGPRGVGRESYTGAGIANPLANVQGVPQGTLLNFNNPTLFTGATLLQALPAIRANLAQLRGDPNNSDFSVLNIQVDKQGSIVDGHLPDASALHISIGAQREIARDFVVSADFVVRHFSHIGGSYPGHVDVNHFLSARGPALPLCSNQQRTDPTAACSLGPIDLTTAIGSARYEGLLVRAEKHFADRWQLLFSYAYSSDVGNNFGNGFDNDNPLNNYGPLAVDFTHMLSISGLVQMPGQFQIGFFSTYTSRPPFSAYLGGIDLNGDGTTGDLLPGTKVNEFNRTLGKSDLRLLVNQFNKTYAGTKDAKGTFIPLITLPANFEFGDPLFSQDLRISREFSYHEHVRLQILGEVFNLFNIANLSGRSGDLLTPGFGQPRSRVTQVFGSGGPRAFQLAARIRL
jgi:Carboxypeptidase regulatory-like domain